jgi:hypothetical protein
MLAMQSAKADFALLQPRIYSHSRRDRRALLPHPLNPLRFS